MVGLSLWQNGRFWHHPELRGFKPRRWQFLYTENCLEQTKILKKRLGMVHFNTKRKCRKVSSGDSFLKMVADDDDDETFTCFPYCSNHSILFTICTKTSLLISISVVFIVSISKSIYVCVCENNIFSQSII